jgi:cytochrome c peroxidase
MTLRTRGQSLLRWFALALTIYTGLFGADFDWNLPKGFPRAAVPPGSPMNAAKVELGRYLFYDKRMSVNGEESCGGCHRQELAFTDGRAHAEGTTGHVHPRGSISLVNVAYTPLLTWANPTLDSLEEQALTPMRGEEPIELGLKGHELEFLDTLRRDPLYQRLFPLAFPETGDVYTLQNVTKDLSRNNISTMKCFGVY